MNKKELKNYIVSSADWELEVDECDPLSAASTATFFKFGEKGKSLLLSTVIMVNTKQGHINNSVAHADFFATSKILKSIGLEELGKAFKLITKSINESQIIK